ncbi:MAG: hypothetical protein D6785_04055, partial [Planctomycetota bacterium]
MNKQWKKGWQKAETYPFWYSKQWKEGRDGGGKEIFLFLQKEIVNKEKTCGETLVKGIPLIYQGQFYFLKKGHRRGFLRKTWESFFSPSFWKWIPYYHELEKLDLKFPMPIGFGWLENSPILLTTFLQGENLWDLMEEQKLELVLTDSFFSLLGAQIGEFHKKGFLHGDLKPANLLVHSQEKRWRIAVVDLDNLKKRRFYSLFLGAKDLENFIRYG